MDNLNPQQKIINATNYVSSLPYYGIPCRAVSIENLMLESTIFISKALPFSKYLLTLFKELFILEDNRHIIKVESSTHTKSNCNCVTCDRVILECRIPWKCIIFSLHKFSILLSFNLFTLRSSLEENTYDH